MDVTCPILGARDKMHKYHKQCVLLFRPVHENYNNPRATRHNNNRGIIDHNIGPFITYKSQRCFHS